MLPAHLEKLLFSALDAEVDSDIAAHIQATLGCLLEAGAPDQVHGDSIGHLPQAMAAVAIDHSLQAGNE